MNQVLLFFFALCLGFVAAIPLGASQIEMAKRAIKGHLLAARMVALGSVSSDIIYGTIALFGIAPFMEIPWVLTAFNIAGALILWILGYLTLKEAKKPHELILGNSNLKNGKWAYFTGFSLAFTNPPMILSWLMGVALAKRLGLATPFLYSSKITFLAGGALGLVGYHFSLISLLHRIKQFIPLHLLGKLYFWLGILLFILSFYFIYGAAKNFSLPL